MKQIFTILFLFIGFLANAQTFQPSKHVVINDALGQAQASPIDGRTMFFDTVNFVWRPFQNTAEVLSYLSVLPTKYRFGNQIIVVDSGGSLQSNGTYLNGHNIFYMFRDSTTNSALVKMWMFNDNPFPQNIVDTLRGLTDSTFSFTQLNGTTNTIKIRGNTQAGNVSSISISSPSLLFNTPSAFTNNSGNWTDTLKFANVSPNAFLGGPASGTPATPTFRFLTTADLPVGIPNGNLLNPFINLSIGTAGTAPNWGTSSVNLGGILLLNIPYASLTTNGIITDSLYAQLIKARDTVFAKGPALYVPPGVPDTIAMYHATIHQAGYADSLDVQYWNAKQQPIQWPYGSLGGVDSVIFGTNITGSIAGGTLTIAANTSSTNNIKWINSLNQVIANTGVGTVYKADSGLLVTLKGSDTVDLKVINDTLFARSGLHAAGIDTIDLGGRLWFNTDLNAHDSVTVTLDSLSAGLYFTVLGNKVAGATDSFLIVTAGGQVLKSAVPTPLTVDSAIWKDNGTYTGSYNLTMGTNTQSFTGSYNGGSGQVNITNNSTNGVAFQISQAGVDNIGEVINETGNAAIGMIISSSGNAAPTGMQINATGAAGAIAIYGSTDIGKAAEFVNNNPNDSNAVQTVETLVQYKGAGSHAGLGTSLDYEFSDSLGYFVVASRLISKWTSSVHGAQNAQTEIWGQNVGTLQKQATFISTGQFQLNQYPGSFTTGDTTTHKPVSMDASGNLYQETYWPGSGGGGTFGLAIGDAITSATQGSILYAGANGNLSQDNGNLYYDSANKRVGIALGGIVPEHTFDIKDTVYGFHFAKGIAKNNPSYSIAIGGSNFVNAPLTGEMQGELQIINQEDSQYNLQMITMGSGILRRQNGIEWFRARGTLASPLVDSTGDFFMSMGFRGWDATNGWSQSAAAYQALTPSVWSATNHETRFQWGVTKNGSTTRLQAMQLNGDGTLYLTPEAAWTPYRTTGVLNIDESASGYTSNAAIFQGAAGGQATLIEGESTLYETYWSKYGSTIGGSPAGTSISLDALTRIQSGPVANQPFMASGNVIYDVIGVTSTNYGTRVDSGGVEMGEIGNLNNVAKAPLDISNNAVNPNYTEYVGSDDGAATRTDGTTKAYRMGEADYTNADLPVALLMGLSGSASNDEYIGGGSNSLTAFTAIHFYTASAVNTHPGTEAMRINSSAHTIVGGTNDAATFSDNGSFAGNYVAQTANYNVAATDYLINCTANTFTVTLPTAIGITGRIYIIKNSGTGSISVATTSSQTIDGVTTQTLGSQYQSITVMSNGANWVIF